MNYIQLHLEKVYKEYLDVKHFLERTLKKENLDKIRDEVAKKSIELETDEEISELSFEKLGWIQILQQDLISLKVRLYHTYEAYKELVEPPKELKEEIEIEIKDLAFNLTYSVKGDEITLVNKESYNFYKNQAFEVEKLYKKATDVQ